MFVNGRLGQTQGYVFQTNVKISKFVDPMQPAVKVGSETSHAGLILLMAEIPNNHLGYIKPVVNNGINYQPQLVIAGFLNHQQ